MLALDGISQFGLADALVVTGKVDQAKPRFEAVVDLFREPSMAAYITTRYAPETGDYSAGIKALGDPHLQMSKAKRVAIAAGFEAMARNDAAGKAAAVQALKVLPDDEMDSLVTRLLGALGAYREALEIVEKKAANESFSAVSWLWYPSMRGSLRDATFPKLVQRLGLVRYWHATHTKPDACTSGEPPPFCRLI